MSDAGEFTLTHTQRAALDRLCRRRPWSAWHGLGSRTMRALQRLGLVEVQVVGRGAHGPRLDWRATAAGKAEMRRRRRALNRALSRVRHG